jgi:hypothetical protein
MSKKTLEKNISLNRSSVGGTWEEGILYWGI